MPCLVVLVGASSAGKSTWAAENFAPEEVVSSDALRAVVGHGPDDLDATDDAFALVSLIVEHRLGRGLVAVVDTLGLDPRQRAGWREVAARHGVPCVAVAFEVAASVARERNRARRRPLPADALRRQLAAWATVRDDLDGEGWASVLRPEPVRPVPAHVRVAPAATSTTAPASADDEPAAPARLRFGLHLSAFAPPAGGSPRAFADDLRAVAAAAERAGFASIWVMDHVRQIPQVGHDWDPMPESYTTLAWLAAATTRVRLGALVTAVTFRNVAHLGKVVATLDVLSGGRAVCGLGLGWYEREHRAYGWVLPPVARRYELLEDALELLPLLWGPGQPSYRGRVLDVPEAICYPRPLQAHVPILVGGGGERRTLRLAARHADAANVLGDAATVARKAGVLRAHCEAEGRDPELVALTHLSTTLVGEDRGHLRDLVDRFRPQREPAARYSARAGAGTVEDQVERFAALAAAGVREAMVSLPEVAAGDGVAAVERFAAVIDAFGAGTGGGSPSRAT